VLGATSMSVLMSMGTYLDEWVWETDRQTDRHKSGGIIVQSVMSCFHPFQSTLFPPFHTHTHTHTHTRTSFILGPPDLDSYPYHDPKGNPTVRRIPVCVPTHRNKKTRFSNPMIDFKLLTRLLTHRPDR